MKCPKCKDRTEVLETAQRGTNTHRRRRCLAPACMHRFTTTETNNTSAAIPERSEDEIRARLLSKEFKGTGKYDNEALAAAIAVDKRRAHIRRQQRERDRAERATWYDNGFEPAPSRLDHETLRRELGEY